MKVNDTIKLLFSVIVLFLLITYSLQKTKNTKAYNAFDISFQTPNGNQSLATYKDKIILLYFGFLTCPEACPTTMTHVSAAFKQLTPTELNKIILIFVDLDPERDTLPKLKEYTSFFHPNIIPFYATLEVLNPFTRYFGVSFLKVPIKSSMGYTIDHSTDIKVISPKGIFLDDIHYGTDSKLMILKIKQLIQENLKNK
jgi:protein SCO1/2